jgi:uncharacterized membrane-anchored protein YitT (DUF2179 family)
MGFGEYQTALFFTSAKLSKDLETEIRYLSGLELFFLLLSMLFFCSLLSADGVSGVSLDLDFLWNSNLQIFFLTFTLPFCLLMWWLWLRTASFHVTRAPRQRAYMMEKFISSRFLVTVTILDIWIRIQKNARRQSMVANEGSGSKGKEVLAKGKHLLLYF